MSGLSSRERQIIGDAGLALYAGRLILEAQPPIDDATLAAVAERCTGPLPDQLVALWRTAFGGRLDYDLSADLGGQQVQLSFSELFYPDSDGYRDLWEWIEHEGDGRLDHLPIGGFEYLERMYVTTAAGPHHGAIVCWRQGLPPGWELDPADRQGWLAADLHALFEQLVLEEDPWESEGEAGGDIRDAVDELADTAVAAKLRRLVRSTVLDWRGALDRRTIADERRLRRLALHRAATGDDVALLARLVEQGCDPAEEVRDGLTPVDVAAQHRALAAVRWLLARRVPVENTLRVGAHAVDLELAQLLLDRGASVDAHTVRRASDNEDAAVVALLERAAR